MKAVLYFIVGCLTIYLIGRLFMKGILHEGEHYFKSKFNNYSKNKKEDGTETKK
jgi:hypothetical protein